MPWIRQEALILAGNDDPIIPMVDARIMKFLLLHASFHINDDGHLGLVTKADELGPVRWCRVSCAACGDALRAL